MKYQMKSKKAQDMKVVVGLIILAIVIIILLQFVFRMSESTKVTMAKQICLQEMIKASTLGKLTKQPDIECPITKITLDGTNTESNKAMLGLVFDTIAVAGEGKLELPKEFWFAGKSDFACVVYSQIEFGEKGKQSYTSGPALTKFAESEKIPNKDKTYKEYFSSIMAENSLAINLNDGRLIDPSKRYATIIRRYSKSYEILGYKIYEAFQPAMVEENKRVAVEIIPEEEIPLRCEDILN